MLKDTEPVPQSWVKANGFPLSPCRSCKSINLTHFKARVKGYEGVEYSCDDCGAKHQAYKPVTPELINKWNEVIS